MKAVALVLLVPSVAAAAPRTPASARAAAVKKARAAPKLAPEENPRLGGGAIRSTRGEGIVVELPYLRVYPIAPALYNLGQRSVKRLVSVHLPRSDRQQRWCRGSL